jgi:hypothetical protein
MRLLKSASGCEAVGEVRTDIDGLDNHASRQFLSKWSIKISMSLWEGSIALAVDIPAKFPPVDMITH